MNRKMGFSQQSNGCDTLWLKPMRSHIEQRESKPVSHVTQSCYDAVMIIEQVWRTAIQVENPVAACLNRVGHLEYQSIAAGSVQETAI